VKSVASWI